MTAKELRKKYTDYDLELVTGFLYDYARFIEESEPYATNTINALKECASYLPTTLED